MSVTSYRDVRCRTANSIRSTRARIHRASISTHTTVPAGIDGARQRILRAVDRDSPGSVTGMTIGFSRIGDSVAMSL